MIQNNRMNQENIKLSMGIPLGINISLKISFHLQIMIQINMFIYNKSVLFII